MPTTDFSFVMYPTAPPLSSTLTEAYLPLEPVVSILSMVIPFPMTTSMDSTDTMSSVGIRSPTEPDERTSSTLPRGPNMRV